MKTIQMSGCTDDAGLRLTQKRARLCWGHYLRRAVAALNLCTWPTAIQARRLQSR